MFVSLAFLFVSIVVAVTLAVPRKHSVGGDTDLLIEYEKQIDRVIRTVWVWFALWLAGAIIGGYAVKS